MRHRVVISVKIASQTQIKTFFSRTLRTSQTQNLNFLFSRICRRAVYLCLKKENSRKNVLQHEMPEDAFANGRYPKKKNETFQHMTGRLQLSSGAANKHSKANRISSLLTTSSPALGSKFARHSRFAPAIARNRHGDTATQQEAKQSSAA